MRFEWDWDHAWAGLLFGTAITGIVLGVIGILMPHNVDYYYVESGVHTATCVYAHKTWNTDDKAFCTNKAGEALEFAELANSLLPNHTQPVIIDPSNTEPNEQPEVKPETQPDSKNDTAKKQ